LVIFIICTISVQADEPTWLFTVPRADSLGESQYNLGFLYAELGITDNLELGIHGVKYSMPDSNLALGISLFPMGSPYIVTSWDVASGKLHLGAKATPYILFAGFETSISEKVKLIAEITNGVSLGVRIYPAQHWTLDIFAAFVTFESYKYEYKRVKREDFRAIPGILFAYSNSL